MNGGCVGSGREEGGGESLGNGTIVVDATGRLGPATEEVATGLSARLVLDVQATESSTLAAAIQPFGLEVSLTVFAHD